MKKVLPEISQKSTSKIKKHMLLKKLLVSVSWFYNQKRLIHLNSYTVKQFSLSLLELDDDRLTLQTAVYN